MASASAAATPGAILAKAKKKWICVRNDIPEDTKNVRLPLDRASVRFGKPEVDTEIDSALVIFIISREPPGGIEPRLQHRLKG